MSRSYGFRPRRHTSEDTHFHTFRLDIFHERASPWPALHFGIISLGRATSFSAFTSVPFSFSRPEGHGQDAFLAAALE